MSVESFSAFYRRYHRLLLSVAQQRLPSFSDAEDVTSEVFRIAWAHDQEGHELTLPWAYQVLRNVIGNEYRRVTRTNSFVQQFSPLLEAALAAPTSDVVEIRRLLRQLPEQDREVVYMSYWEDLSGSEIAAILGCSGVAVRVRLMRARKKLKGLLESAPSETRGSEVAVGRA